MEVLFAIALCRVSLIICKFKSLYSVSLLHIFLKKQYLIDMVLLFIHQITSSFTCFSRFWRHLALICIVPIIYQIWPVACCPNPFFSSLKCAAATPQLPKSCLHVQYTIVTVPYSMYTVLKVCLKLATYSSVTFLLDCRYCIYCIQICHINWPYTLVYLISSNHDFSRLIFFPTDSFVPSVTLESQTPFINHLCLLTNARLKSDICNYQK